jgi:hypothetical protein
MKICSSCGNSLDISLFSFDKSRKDGFYHACKPCHKAYRQSTQQKQTIKEYWANHYENNKAKYCAKRAKRRASLLNATPKWLSKEQLTTIECKYSVVEMLSKHSAEKYSVDHIVPLQGKTVCGLHVPWNLQVIKAYDNLKKGNRFNG